MKKFSLLALCTMLSLPCAFADTYVKTGEDKSIPSAPRQKSEFDVMRSVPTVNAEGRKPMLRSIHFEEQIESAQSKNPGKALLIDARKGKVVGAVSLSQQKDIASHSSRLQAHQEQSGVQSLPPQVPIAPYEMQEETIHLSR
ncbi:MAG: hypothetical protein K2O85_04230 [Helicobacter sp.]|nr:hypothetical protein [Helicobacter sp.]